jgi:hypothetical protein
MAVVFKLPAKLVSMESCNRTTSRRALELARQTSRADSSLVELAQEVMGDDYPLIERHFPRRTLLLAYAVHAAAEMRRTHCRATERWFERERDLYDEEFLALPPRRGRPVRSGRTSSRSTLSASEAATSCALSAATPTASRPMSSFASARGTAS